MKNTIKRKSKDKSEAVAGVVFASPAMIGFVVFSAIPMLASLILSFTDYRIVNDMKFIGLENYRYLLSGENPFFYKSLFVTFYYMILSVPIGVAFHFFSAILMNAKIKGKGFFRVIYYIPSVIPMAASCMIWLWMFNPDRGLLNYLLDLLHLPASQWVGSEASVIPSIVIIAVWMAGNTMVVFLAGLQDIPTTLYEAMEIDGGNAFHKLFYITIPLSTPLIFFNSVMGLIRGMQVFIQPLIMTDGGPNNGSLFYALNLYREGFEYSRMGVACAMAWILFVIILIITGLYFKLSKRWVFYAGN